MVDMVEKVRIEAGVFSCTVVVAADANAGADEK